MGLVLGKFGGSGWADLALPISVTWLVDDPYRRLDGSQPDVEGGLFVPQNPGGAIIVEVGLRVVANTVSRLCRFSDACWLEASMQGRIMLRDSAWALQIGDGAPWLGVRLTRHLNPVWMLRDGEVLGLRLLVDAQELTDGLEGVEVTGRLVCLAAGAKAG